MINYKNYNKHRINNKNSKFNKTFDKFFKILIFS